MSIFSLRGRQPKDTFHALLKVENKLSEVVQVVTDGEGTATPLSLSADKLVLGGVAWPSVAGTEHLMLTIGADGSAKWADVRHGYEKANTVAFASAITLQLSEVTNYVVSVSGNTTITLPSTAGLPAGTVLSITVRVDQTAASTITWAGNGNTVKLSGDSTPAGSGKATVYSFIHYVGKADWLGGIIWSQA